MTIQPDHVFFYKFRIRLYCHLFAVEYRLLAICVTFTNTLSLLHVDDTWTRDINEEIGCFVTQLKANGPDRQTQEISASQRIGDVMWQASTSRRHLTGPKMLIYSSGLQQWDQDMKQADDNNTSGANKRKVTRGCQ